MPWLTETNPNIDWKSGKMTIKTDTGEMVVPTQHRTKHRQTQTKKDRHRQQQQKQSKRVRFADEISDDRERRETETERQDRAAALKKYFISAMQFKKEIRSGCEEIHLCLLRDTTDEDTDNDDCCSITTTLPLHMYLSHLSSPLLLFFKFPFANYCAVLRESLSLVISPILVFFSVFARLHFSSFLSLRYFERFAFAFSLFLFLSLFRIALSVFRSFDKVSLGTFGFGSSTLTCGDKSPGKLLVILREW